MLEMLGKSVSIRTRRVEALDTNLGIRVAGTNEEPAKLTRSPSMEAHTAGK